jgi:hypothetical protein
MLSTGKEGRLAVQKRKREQGADAVGEGLPGLGAEIEALRELLRQALVQAGSLGDSEQEQQLTRLMEVLDSLSRTAARLGRLLVSQRALADDGLFGEAMREAMDRAMRKLSTLDGEGGSHGRG